MRTASIMLVAMCLCVWGCKKSKSSQPPDYTPAKVALLLPANDEACYSGVIKSATESDVTFSWNTATNADSYQLTYTNLLTNEITIIQSISNTQTVVGLLPNTPYSWYITSISNKTSATTKSDVWEFYNSGPATTSHAPFPAEIIFPGFNQTVSIATGSVTLSWKGSDVDNDIKGYDVYFGNINTPPLYKSNVAESSLTVDSLAANKTYYWSITTKDSKGNSSNSAISKFEINYLPIADFGVNGDSTTVYQSQKITFRDKSLNNPTTWSWSFPGGSPSSSSSQNPTVTYANVGIYTVTLTVHNQNGSDTKTKSNYITVNKPWTCGMPITDPRDGQVYNTVNINGKCWMVENLKYTDNNTIGVNYGNSTSAYDTYGRLYSFNEVQNGNLAPPGWHIPTESEINDLSLYILQTYNNNAGVLKATNNLWAPPNSGATNQTGFSAIPSGNYFSGVFNTAGYAFYMWTSTAQGNSGGDAVLLSNDNTGFSLGYYSGDHYFAVRCVKN